MGLREGPLVATLLNGRRAEAIGAVLRFSYYRRLRIRGRMEGIAGN